jgi:hypothetical protein
MHHTLVQMVDIVFVIVIRIHQFNEFLQIFNFFLGNQLRTSVSRNTKKCRNRK